MYFSQMASRINSIPFPLNGRVAIVTGATNGIGRATALHLASLGASISLVISSSSVETESSSVEADRVAAEINSASSDSIPRAITIRADVSDTDAVRSVFDLTEQTFKSPPHIVFHSAFILDPEYHPITSTPLAVFDSIMSMNARNTFIVLQEAANRVVRDGGGRIITLSSWLVKINRPGYGVYTASKAAIEAMVKTLAKELHEKRITVNCIAPGPGEMDVQFAGTMKEDPKTGLPVGHVGPIVGFISSDWGEWVNGRVISVEGGIY